MNLEFEPSKKITMIFGENGNGKSTITDSIVCLCTNEHGSLDDKSSIDKSFYNSLNSTPEDVEIILNTDTGVFTAKMSKAGIFAKSPDKGHPTVRHLRRSQITQLIEEQPAKRYEKLQSYIDVNNIAKAEDALRKAKKDTDDELKIIIATLNNATKTLEDVWKAEGMPLTSWEEWAKSESARDITAEIKKYHFLQEIQKNWIAINELKTKLLKDNDTLDKVEAKQELAQAQLDEALEKDKNVSPDLLSLLQNAKKYIATKESLAICPVCNNGIEQESVVKSLTAKIDSMEIIKGLSESVGMIRQEARGKMQVYNSTRESLYRKIVEIESSVSAIKEPPYIELIVKLNFLKTDATEEEKINAFLLIYDEVNNILNEQKEITERTKTAIDQNNLIKGQYRSIRDSKAKLEKVNMLCEAMKDTLEIAEKARKEFVQNELTSISSEVDRLYQKIHPNEELGGISMKLKKSAKNSLELSADFHTRKAITPQSVYSESHLDTLGICVFIALAKRYGAENSILILDDVVMSVDEKHLDRFIELLHDECGEFAHILITTHYRPWRDRYRYNRAPSSKVHFIELRTWSIQKGIRVLNGRIALDELKEMLNDEGSFHRENIAAASGRILENLLDFITFRFACRIARRPKNDYHLSELLDGLSKDLLKHLKVEHLEKDITGKYTSVVRQVELKPIIDRLKALKAIRNQVGAHFSFDGASVNDGDIEDFGNATVELAELLICPECGALPDRNKSGSYWETKTGSIRLYPLMEP